MRERPELLAPAGDMERLKMAVLYGADAVYLAGTDFGMRAFAGNFSPEELPKAVAFAHDHGVRVHCTINTMPRNDEIARLPEHLELLDHAGVDALIVADLGAFTMAGKYAPHCQRHISTQASICNYETARAWYDLGAGSSLPGRWAWRKSGRSGKRCLRTWRSRLSFTAPCASATRDGACSPTT